MQKKDIGLKTNARRFVTPLQYLLSLDDVARFNKPGTIKDNWTWKLISFDVNLTNSVRRFGKLSSTCGRQFENAHFRKVFPDYLFEII